jgi:hypothetical protein
MLNINLKIEEKDLIDWLKIKSEETKISIDELIVEIVVNYKNKYPIKISSSTNTRKLINFYQKEYKNRFNIDCDENINENLIAQLIKKINKSTEDEQTTIEVLQKAIIWYLYVHPSEGPNGQKYPYQFRIFLEQDWLRRQCIESSNNLTINFIKKVIATHRNPREIIKALQRGDVSQGFDTIDISQEWESTLKLAMKLLKEKKLTQEAKDNPKIKNLFQTEIPSIEYIRKARHLLEKVELTYS